MTARDVKVPDLDRSTYWGPSITITLSDEARDDLRSHLDWNVYRDRSTLDLETPDGRPLSVTFVRAPSREDDPKPESPWDAGDRYDDPRPRADIAVSDRHIKTVQLLDDILHVAHEIVWRAAHPDSPVEWPPASDLDVDALTDQLVERMTETHKHRWAGAWNHDERTFEVDPALPAIVRQFGRDQIAKLVADEVERDRQRAAQDRASA